MYKLKPLALLSGLGILFIAGCGTAPKTPAAQQSLQANVDATLDQMRARVPSLDQMLQESYGYIVFPSVGKGGAVVGGAFGRGIVYQNGQPIGFASLSQASIGAQLGGQTFAELLLIRDANTMRRVQEGKFDFGARASAVVLTAGAAAATDFGADDVIVFVLPKGGLMVDLSLSGQRINFERAAL